MKVILYTVDMRLNPQDEHQVLVPSMMPWSEENEALARELAYDGEISVVEMDDPTPVQEPTTDEVVNALLGVE